LGNDARGGNEQGPRVPLFCFRRSFVDIGDADGMLLEQAEQHRIDKQMTEAIGVDLSSTAVEKMRKIIKEKQLLPGPSMGMRLIW